MKRGGGGSDKKDKMTKEMERKKHMRKVMGKGAADKGGRVQLDWKRRGESW